MSEEVEKNSRIEILDVFDAPESDTSQIYTFETNELTALCPFDFGGPDFYELELRYVPGSECIESRSLKQYIESFRDSKISAEELGAEMYGTFERVVNPERMYLRLDQARRGGIEERVEFGDQSLKTD